MKRSRLGILVGAGACVLVLAGAQRLQAGVLFADNFDRADSRNIDESLSGVTDNTGSALAADAVYTQPFLDPNNAPPTYGAQDGDAVNGGGAQISGNVLQLAVGAGTSNAYVNHNFLNTPAFAVSVDVTGYGGTSNQQGGAFAVGMSEAEAASAGDAFGGHPIGSTTPGDKLTDAFEGTANDGTAVSDFWVALRGNNTIVWGGFGAENEFGSVGVGAKTGTISAEFYAADFNAGSNVNYKVFYNGALQGTGSFPWSGTNENYIALDARDGGSVGFDNLAVTTVPEPAAAMLAALAIGGLGVVRRRRAA
ncbi:MAG: hypothetical protein KDA44_12120 [Planctomycetales bacterium]|nr:hypothetical protein [Planctomycetales bacterium]